MLYIVNVKSLSTFISKLTLFYFIKQLDVIFFIKEKKNTLEVKLRRFGAESTKTIQFNIFTVLRASTVSMWSFFLIYFEKQPSKHKQKF